MQESESPLLRDMPLEKLAELADRIAATVAAAAAMTPDNEARHSRLEEKIEQLSASIAAMRTSAPGRSHGNSRSRSRSLSRGNRDVYCWYHAEWGTAAVRTFKVCSREEWREQLTDVLASQSRDPLADPSHGVEHTDSVEEAPSQLEDVRAEPTPGEERRDSGTPRHEAFCAK
ncbi:hypothetical protein HPB50_017921 [Hyalomma asiaticum]|uniref:Uncharacterized protein n=1 Tax=Hyalomma asiaticum TaxID=266040 RepID=A0ACB7T3H8_HYAAI|nr:hypothetical protein HPB50_017921 [Hyalomma asiaticum]